MTQELFVVGDVHGKYGLLTDILKKWDETCQQLIFIGDLIDRGEDSRSCLELVCQLVQQFGAICLMGNHEWMLLRYLDDPEQHYAHYQKNGGDSTINSLLERPLTAKVNPIADAEAIWGYYAELIDQIRSFPYFYETTDYLFVHAGLDLTLEDERETSDYDKIWLRESFHQAPNQTGKKIVFGHTPTHLLFDSPVHTNQLWLTKDGKIGIDGGAVYGGVLHGLVLGPDGPIADHQVGEGHFG